MINDLFVNALLLISITFIIGHLLKHIPKRIIDALYSKMLLGVGGGLMGILLMIYTIEIKGTNTLLDLRIFAIMTVSCIGGAIPTIVSGIIIGVYRAVHFGVNISSIVAIFQILLCIIYFNIIDKTVNVEWKKWVFKTLISLIVLTSTFYYLLRNVDNVQIIFFQFYMVAILASILEYLLLNYVRHSNELYYQYKEDSTKDFLTGLYNTRQFDNILKIALKGLAKNSHKKLSCLMIDIDHFKNINDTYGHCSGDMVLKEIAHLLKKNCRDFDIVFRVGGEEFCVLLFDCTKDQAFQIALRMNMDVQKYPFPIGEAKFINITVSVGIAVYPDTIPALQDIKHKADMALYNAKNSGRNNVCLSDMCIFNKITS